MPTEKELLAAARKGRKEAGSRADDVEAFVHMLMECWPLIWNAPEPVTVRVEGVKGPAGEQGPRGQRGPDGRPGSDDRADVGITGVAIVGLGTVDDPERVKAFETEVAALAKIALSKLPESEIPDADKTDSHDGGAGKPSPA